MTTVPVSVAKAQAATERLTALNARRGGATFDEIAEQMGLPVKRVQRILQDALADARQQVAEQAAELRAMELSRLDALQMGVWGAAAAGNLFAVDRVLKIMERRAKLLGLDVQPDRDSERMAPEEIARLAQEAIQQAMATSSAATGDGA